MLLLCVGWPWGVGAQTPAGPVVNAQEALARGEFDRVTALMRDAAGAEASRLLALAEIGQGEYAAGQERLEILARQNATGEAALDLALLRLTLGQRVEAQRDLRALINRTAPGGADDLIRLGRAARALGEVQTANTFFRGAAALAPDDPRLHTAWGEAFLDAHDNREAAASFQEALALDAEFVPAQVGLARVFVQDNPPGAQELLTQVIEVNPSHVEALLILADLAVDSDRREDATDLIDQVQKINPNHLDALALEAAIAFLDDDQAAMAAAVQRALAINPTFGDIYRVAGDHASRNYLFDEAVRLTRQALALQPDNTAAYANLGMQLLRAGDEIGARQALERAFEDDPFDVLTFNSLEMLDRLDTFVTIEDEEIVMRLPADEVEVLRHYAVPLAHDALETLSALYGYRPDEAVLVELFSVHDDFAVRTIGLRGFVGALGACFGRVVTMDSPTARPPGTFSWESTLWHEMAHVITLQMSNNRVPRWLSEGLSVFEERRARPEWGRESLLTFVQAYSAGELIPLATLNDAFANAETINLAYYQASVVVDHLVEAYGEPALHDLLRAYGDGLESEEAIERVYGVSMDGLQDSFDQYMVANYSRLSVALARPEGVNGGEDVAALQALAESNPQSFGLQLLLGDALWESGDATGALAALGRAQALVPGAPGGANPNGLIAEIALAEGDTVRAISALEAHVRADHFNVEAARQLVALLVEGGDQARLRNAYARVVAIDPFDSMAQRGLGQLALDEGDSESAVRAFRAVVGSEPPDLAQAHFDLARALLQDGDTAGAKRSVLSALEMAPAFEAAQDLLLDIIDRELGGA